MEYQHGKIYTIRSHQTDKYYIGSTNQKTLAQRLGKHRINYTQYLSNKYGYMSSYEILQYTDHYIELLELYPCNTKDELHRREGELIRQYKSDVINIVIPGNRTLEQITEQKKEHMKQYRLDNKVSIAEHAKQRVMCNCGITSSKHHISSHLKTNIHTININNLYLNELNYYIL